MANYRDHYYDEVDEIIERIKPNPFVQPLEDPVPQEQTGQIQPVGWVSNADEDSGEATVTIDSEGITIEDGKLTLKDHSGISVLTAGGFAGTWINFLLNGVYNGGFDSGGVSTGQTEVTLVSDAETEVNYVESLSSIAPGWIVSNVAGTATYGIDDDATRGLNFRVNFPNTGSSNKVTIFQDIPVVAEWDFELIINAQCNFANGELEISTQERGASHADIGELVVVRDSFSSAAGFSMGHTVVHRAEVEEHTRFLRVFLTFSGGTGTGEMELYNVAFRPRNYVRAIEFRGPNGVHTQVDELYRADDGMHLELGLSPADSISRAFTIDVDDTGIPTLKAESFVIRPTADTLSQGVLAVLRDGSIELGAGGAARDVTLRRSGAGVLTLDPGVLRIESTSDASLASTGHGLQIGPAAGINLILDNNEIMARNNGAASTLLINAHGGEVGFGDNVVRIGEAWVAPTLGSSWVNFGSGHPPAGYRKDAQGWVHLRGLVRSGTFGIGNTMFTLPVGFRPASVSGGAAHHFAVGSNNAFGMVAVIETGSVEARVGSATWLDLNGVRFKAEN